ncbi:thiamine pyrophosphate-dependent enzyme [Phenylobacterium sp. LjRoot219]|uniref:alpha-ketoacid dehydrogenase subunit alpha/beta n=1 Tax=Phenylobacterium sp. LjRoot219 TaxID=3342283 RepID=UPI003ECF8867
MAQSMDIAACDLRPLDAYQRMFAIRTFEQHCLELSQETIAGSVHLCGGQEAIPVGARAALRKEDRVVATYRGHGWAIEWGVPLVDLLAEICQRAGGVNGGRAGSPYLMAPEYGFIGENSIVGAGVPIAAGVAMAAQAASNGRVCLVAIGDGATNQGAVHEALNFAAVRNLPLIIVVENNEWSEMTPISATANLPNLSDRAAAYGIPGLTIDGNDPFAVCAAVRDAAERARSGGGPTLIEAKTVRLMGHYNRDYEHYRSKAEVARSAERDPLPRLRGQLIAGGLADTDLCRIESQIAKHLEGVVARVLAMPGPDPATAREHVTARIEPAVIAKVATRDMPYWQAVNEALRAELIAHPETVLYGEDVGIPGGIFGCTRGLQKEFGPERVFDTPISESAILGSAVGAAMEGMRPIVEIMWADFLLVALDPLINQAANIRYISRGDRSAPLVVRTQQGVTPGSCAQHSQSLEALLAHIPGLRVGLPAYPDDAYSMLRAAINDPDPVIIIEARSLYQLRGEVTLLGSAPAIGDAALRRHGSDLAIITWGATCHKVEEAASQLAGEGIEASVLDLRWLSPLDHAAISEAIAVSGGRVLVVHEANLTGGFGAEIAALITEQHFSELRAPVVRIATPDVRIPASPALQNALIPQCAQIVEAARLLMRR